MDGAMFSSKSILPGLFCVTALIFTCCIQISVYSLDVECGTDNNCTSVVENSFCNNSVCLCSDGYYRQNTTTCLPIEEIQASSFSHSQDSPWSERFTWKSSANLPELPSYSISYHVTVNPGSLSNSTTGESLTVQNLKAGKSYSAIFITIFKQDGKTEVLNNKTIEFTTQKIPVSEMCKTGDVCSDSNASCSSTNPTRCLCNEGYFWGSAPLNCTPVTHMKVKNISFINTYRENTTVTWQQDGDTSVISRYEISWTPDKGSKNESASLNTSNITKLKPGTKYTVTVTTVINDSMKMQKINKTATIATIQALTKKCSNPKRECGQQQYSAECSETGVCRCVSGKYRNKDGKCHPVDELKPNSFTYTEVSFWCVKLTWKQSDYISQAADSTISYEVNVGSSQNSSSGTLVTVSGLQAGKLYTASIVTILDQDGKSERTNSIESPEFTTEKIPNNKTCKAGDVCSDSNASCSSTNPTRCLCNEGFFWSPKLVNCTPVNHLKLKKISFIDTNRENTTVTWQQEGEVSVISRYEISWISDSGSKNKSSTSNESVVLTKLKPGTKYTVTVTTVINDSMKIQKLKQTATVTTIQALTKKCSNPRRECGQQQYSAECSETGVCRCVSGKYRNKDGKCHPVDELKPNSFTYNEVSFWRVKLKWKQSDYISQAADSTILYEVSVGSSQNSSSGTSVTVSGLQAGMLYTASIVTILDQDGKSERTNSTESPQFTTKKIPNNETCKAGDVCSDSNAVCRSTNPTRCLCNEGYFWGPTPLTCTSVTYLKLKTLNFININRKNTTVTWQQEGDVSVISRYEISWTPDNGNKTESSTSRKSVITNLKPGTEYTVTVTTVVNDNNKIQKTPKTATVTTIQALTKKCSNPTRDCGQQQYSAECSETGVCRCFSGKYRNKDKNCHPVDELKPNSFTDTEVSFWSVILTWKQSDYISQAADSTISYEVSVGSSQKNSSGTSVTVSGLQAGKLYTANIVTIVDQDGKSERTNSIESPEFTTKKIPNNETCKAGDLCLDSNAFCSFTNPTRCLCNEGYFWGPTPLTCTPVIYLNLKNISFINTNRENTTVTWQQEGELSVISRYEISWTPDNGNKTVLNTSTESVITNLKPGTEYTVTVTTVINDNTKIQKINKTAIVTTIQALTKKCSNPTRECGQQQYSAECSETGFCRCVSGKYRNKDGKCHPVDELKPKSFTDTEVSFWSVILTWKQSDYISQAADSTISYEVSVGSSQNSSSGTSVTVSGLQAGKLYTANIVTIVDQDGKSERTNSIESPEFTTKKIPNNETCKAGDVCSDSNASCSSTNPTRCLCNEGYFWGLAPLNCIPVYQLKPEINQVSRTGTTSLQVNWTPATLFGQYVTRYYIIWTPVDMGSDFVYPNYTGDIRGLTPGKQYTVLMRAFIVQEGREQSVVSSSFSQRTFPDKPGPFDEEKSNLTAPHITLYFKKSEGIVDYYIVTLTGDSDSYKQTQNVRPSGDLQVVDFSDITAERYYTLHITAVSFSVYSETYTFRGIRGSLKPPGKVKSLSVSDITYSSMFVSWNRPDDPNGVIFAYILTLQQISNQTCQQKVVLYCSDCTSMRNVDSDMHCEGVTPVKVNINSSVLNDAGKEFSYNLTHLLPFTNYTVSVFTYNELDSGPASNVYQTTVTKPLDLKSVIRKPSEETLYERQFVVIVHPRSVYKNVAGHVKLAGIIVFRQDVYTAERRFRRNTHSTDDYSSYTNWYISNLTDFKLPYRATNDSWINKDHELEKYVVGSMNCSSQKDSFCNGPLKPATKYTAVLFACTDVGCQESSGIQFETKTAKSEKQNQVSSAVIAFSVVTVILFLLLVVVGGILFWYVRRHRVKRGFSKRNSDLQNDQYEMMSSVQDGGHVGNLSNREVSGLYNVPLSEQRGDTQQIETSTFGNDGYVNVRQAAAGENEYERLGSTAPSQNVYSKLT